MTGLLDIGELTSTVEVRGVQLTVKGIAAKDILLLLQDFPEMRKLMSGGNVTLTAELLIAQIPGALSHIVAAACGYGGDNEEALRKAESLTLGEQTAIIREAWKLTFPQGTQSFLDALSEFGLGSLVGTGSEWDPGTTSPGRSKNLSHVAIPDPPSGLTRPA